MIQFIDANCMLGQRMSVREGSLKTTQDVAEMMDRVGIVQAVCYHSTAKENVPAVGNPMLNDEVGKDPRFLKQWVVMPNFWEEYMDPDRLLAEMKANGVTSVRMCPQSHGYSMAPYSAGELIEALAEKKVPIFVEKAQIPAWEDVYSLCKNFPKARFILLEAGYGCVRQLAPVLKHCDNLWVETSNLLMHMGIAEFCRFHGAHRLIFGSGAPYQSMAAAVSQIRYSDISEKEMKMIASENISGLLGEVSL